MKLLRPSFRNRRWLLPLVLAASVIFVANGMAVPTASPRHKTGPLTFAVAKTPCCAAPSGIAKSPHCVDLCGRIDVTHQPAVHRAALDEESPAAASAFDSAIPPRAPPA